MRINKLPSNGSGIKVLLFYAAKANLPVTNSSLYSGFVSVTSTLHSCENQILPEPTGTGTALLAGPASFLSRPPFFRPNTFFASPSAFTPICPFHDFIRSGWRVPSPPRAASSQRLLGSPPASLHPRPLLLKQTTQLLLLPGLKAASHIWWAGSGRERGAKEHLAGGTSPHLSPCPSTCSTSTLPTHPCTPRDPPAFLPGGGDGLLKRLLKAQRTLQTQT